MKGVENIRDRSYCWLRQIKWNIWDCGLRTGTLSCALVQVWTRRLQVGTNQSPSATKFVKVLPKKTSNLTERYRSSKGLLMNRMFIDSILGKDDSKPEWRFVSILTDKRDPSYAYMTCHEMRLNSVRLRTVGLRTVKNGILEDKVRGHLRFLRTNSILGHV